ncbi:MAG: aspartate kinase [Lachnospiraceae bacterium]|nr:aspartate kinase [Lachnospiraceae bacterium]
MRTVVTKFGGTSLADAGQFRKVKAILDADPDRRIVVASAPGKRFSEDIKVTDMLIKCYKKAAAGQDFTPVLNEIRERFQGIIDELELDFSLDDHFEYIRQRLEMHPNREFMESRGEYLNSQLLAAYLGFTFVDPEWCVCFNEDGTFDSELTSRTLGAALKPLKNAVVAGFYGADRRGNIRTFSRGGSDITGSLCAQAIDAEIYENWTDVTGLLAADPRIVEKPRSVDYLTYRELRTLSYMGASVLHSDAVLPVSKKGIPINIRNTNSPEEDGTMIVKKLPAGRERAVITGVTGKTGMCVIQVEKVMVSNESGFTAVLLDILKKRKIPFEQCLTGIDTVSLVMQSNVFAENKTVLLDEIKRTLKPDLLNVKENLSMIAVVGEAENGYKNATVKIVQAVTDAGIEISTINQGAGELNLLIGVAEDRYKDAIQAIYSSISKHGNSRVRVV